MQHIQCILLILFNFILYFIFGSLITGRRAKKEGRAIDVPLTMIAGFFLYYSLFTFACVPVMYRWRPLSMLTVIWEAVCIAIILLSVILNWKIWKKSISSSIAAINDRVLFYTGLAVVIILQTVIVLGAYQFTLDAAYYVANVATSLKTNSLNIYDPYTGDWQDHFEMRYFFATYPMQDAVMCKIFNIEALLQTKTIMASVVIIMTNLVYYMIGQELFEGDRKKTFLMLLFGGVINFFFITIYTSSNFLVTRTYEGKSILGNIILPAILYIYLRLIKEAKKEIKRGESFLVLFLICFGATVISNSSNMLVPMALAVLFVPWLLGLFVKKKYKLFILDGLRVFACMLPGIFLILVYVAYVKGMFVFYTYPR